MTFGKLSEKENKALSAVSAALGVPPSWLYSLIQFESGWIPDRRAGLPYNLARVKRLGEAPKYARGLIQFIDSTAAGLGYRDSLELVEENPTIEKQLLNPVYKYLNAFKPFPTEQALYMAVFNPASRYVHPETVFSDSIRAANPGINTPADYVARVKGLKINAGSGGAIVALLALGFFLYKFFPIKGGSSWQSKRKRVR